MCEEAGISEKKTNHSLRASGASAMFNADVPEKMIKSVTGHKSSKALAIYERPTIQQQQAVSGVLMGGSSSYVSKGQSSAGPSYRMQQPSGVPNSASMVMSSMFSGLNNCNITISPQNFHVHIQPSTAPQPSLLSVDSQLDEFDQLVQSLPPY